MLGIRNSRRCAPEKDRSAVTGVCVVVTEKQQNAKTPYATIGRTRFPNRIAIHDLFRLPGHRTASITDALVRVYSAAVQSKALSLHQLLPPHPSLRGQGHRSRGHAPAQQVEARRLTACTSPSNLKGVNIPANAYFVSAAITCIRCCCHDARCRLCTVS